MADERATGRAQAAGAEWWRGAVVYQIYPRSFQDSNGDGIGDLEGIIARLDYLNDGTERSLGVDAVWLSPIFRSPMRDFGYDVSDYCDVDPVFGDLPTFDRLLAECHRRGIRVLLDWVPNHTSDQHPWFLESRSSRESPKRHWYVWRDPKPDGSPPNNWRSAFGGPAWTFDERTGQYYLHSFLPEQPDLNWRNPEVVAAMHETLRFWLRRGVDGFRMDVIGKLMKHPDLADNPPNPHWDPSDPTSPKLLGVNDWNYPDVFEAVRGIRRVLDEFPGAVAVGEVFGTTEEIARFYGDPEKLDGLHLPFNFQLIHAPVGRRYTPWDAAVIARVIEEAERVLPPRAEPCWVLNNHDRSRFVSRHGRDGHGLARARAAALLLLGLRGTIFLYYGEELGMPDVEIPPARQLDPARLRSVGRDPARTPMLWDEGPGRGFTTGKPWLPFGPAGISVAAQDRRPDSILNLYRRAVWTRRTEPALGSGALELLGASDGVLAFRRSKEGARSIVVLVNTAAETRTVPVSGPVRILLSSDERAVALAEGKLELGPFAAAWVEEAGR